jgi:hypothetical protein
LALLDKLLYEIENILAKQKELEAENLRLKEEIRILKENEEIRLNIKKEEESNIQELSDKLQKLLTL